MDVCFEGISGRDAAVSNLYDLIILDVMLAGMSVFEIAKDIKHLMVQNIGESVQGHGKVTHDLQQR